MRNGIYFTLILFLGTFAFTIIERISGNVEKGLVFVLASFAIAFLTTHFKRNIELAPIQKVINVVFISLVALYGMYSAVVLLMATELMSIIVVEAILYLVGSFILLFSLVLFIKEQVYHDSDKYQMA